MSQWQKGEFEVVWPKPDRHRGADGAEARLELTSRGMTLGAWLELIASGLITGGIYALVALGLNLQYGLMRILNIAHGEFLMLGAFLDLDGATYAGHGPAADRSPVIVAAASPARAWRSTACSSAACCAHGAERGRVRGARPDLASACCSSCRTGALLLWGGDLRGYELPRPAAAMLGTVFPTNQVVAFAAARRWSRRC